MKYPVGLTCLYKGKDVVVIVNKLVPKLVLYEDRDIVIRFIKTNLMDYCRESDLVPNNKFFKRLYRIKE